MSRRNTIIIATLVNAGLLMLLFTTATKTNKAEKGTGYAPSSHEFVNTLSEEDLLNQYVMPTASLHEEEEELVLTEVIDLPFTPVVAIKELEESSSKEEVRYVNVTVKKGDFLEKIAKANNTTVAAIIDANNIKPTQLKVGQVLKVPLSEKGNSSANKRPPTQEEKYYVVKEGDNPWLIASRNHINLETLLQLNDLDEKKAKRIRPGDRLRIH